MEQNSADKSRERREFANTLIKEIVKEYDEFSRELESMLKTMKEKSQGSKE